MRILFLTQNWFPDVYGGSQRVAAEQARELARLGHEVVVCTERISSTLPIYEEHDGVKIWRYGNPNVRAVVGASVVDCLALPHLIRDLEREHRFDCAIIHHTYPGYGFIRSGVTIPMLYVFHASTAREAVVEGVRRWKHGVRRFIAPFVRSIFIQLTRHVERTVLNRAKRIVVFSQFSLELLRETYPAAGQKAMVVPVGVDTETFHPAKNQAAIRRALHLPPSKFSFFTVRRLTERMGLHELVGAMKIVVAKHKHCQLLIAGTGPLEIALKAQAAKLGLKDSVVFLGRITDKTLGQYYQAVDCFVLPTQAFEGFGMATAEALSSGLPAVGTPAGATPELLEPIHAGLVTKGLTSADIAEAMLGFMQLDEATRVKIARAARAYMTKHYAWPMAGKALEKILKTLI